ncbi:MAG: tRNA uridine(34) 5-carboxymethylaminomethyl modification radical SAM/GNAT enzyme Elp3 [Candidatus Magasanikbacteria bacterium]|nr:tRNA uridine(34) 5-carboxymethylaminomethyl modification radical SAM/GNAT enzyme Elp3 [Candidatus Magasanikbacteria bacterium]MCA9390772.1 tRNA uridine(34) 5-carboxymethylaminomethyl modification radical SAM/GNAT enzyme Elp3 [Candidatus Magasanikbacteria bacterium]USN52522.1 MAG: tRNA uridine(34) 5-carboxymethylaminomethyl modification radical SAM/GNAT enzyme Elp3 [Candidatus Nomurabacteria bacterium]HPF95499.1 tRNA uridine(34) 5-carboxymethylaminomethyl modification radical SAM/GNAT enzyme E
MNTSRPVKLSQKAQNELFEQVIIETLAHDSPTRALLATTARKLLKGTGVQFPTLYHYWTMYHKLVKEERIQASESFEKSLRVKDIRTDSGVAPITVLTKPYPCPGKCVYCPTETRMPKSYISSEPAAARALSLKFDPYQQVWQRVTTLEHNGHEAKKIELIIKGGTWSSYRWDYRKWFIKRCFDAANHLGQVKKTRYGSLAASQKANETAEYRIIGLTIETRPDWVTAKDLIRLRELGCTRVELGVQTLQNDVLDITNRGHHIDATIRANALLRMMGFKTDFHVLPGQPGSTPAKDIEDMRTLFNDQRYCPDMIKLYPCVVLPLAELHEWAKDGRFTPLEGDELKETLITMQTLIPRYCRVSRLIRDFPENDISYGNKVTNLRTVIEDEMKARGLSCECLRCREVGHVAGIDPSNVTTQVFEQRFDSAAGTEIFLTVEDTERRAVFAFLRLRLPPTLKTLLSHPDYSEDKRLAKEAHELVSAFPIIEHTAFVRELHTYGTALNLTQDNKDASQHRGYGRLLMQKAEEISKDEGYEHISVISGIGVREYYKMLGYEERESYMVKTLKK